MTPSVRSVLVTVAVAFAAGLGGVWLGQAISASTPHHASLHEAIHRDLDLSAAQRERIEGLEHDFDARRQALEVEMRTANAELATAVREEHGYGPRVTAAIEHCHHVMGELQSATMAHVFAMREVMTPDQQQRFDGIVASALVAEPQ